MVVAVANLSGCSSRIRKQLTKEDMHISSQQIYKPFIQLHITAVSHGGEEGIWSDQQ